MDAVDAEAHLNVLLVVFAIASLGAIIFFVGRANAVSEDVTGWAHRDRDRGPRGVARGWLDRIQGR